MEAKAENETEKEKTEGGSLVLNDVEIENDTERLGAMIECITNIRSVLSELGDDNHASDLVISSNLDTIEKLVEQIEDPVIDNDELINYKEKMESYHERESYAPLSRVNNKMRKVVYNLLSFRGR